MPFPDEMRDVEVVGYRPGWPREFDAVAADLRMHLTGVASGIDHVGSTAVPGLAAKDVLDLQVRIGNVDETVTERFCGLGFRLRAEVWNRQERRGDLIWPKLAFAAPPAERLVNVHVRQADVATTRAAFCCSATT